MAFAHHNAPRCDERGSRKSELVSAQYCGHRDVTTGPKAAVNLDCDSSSKTIEDQRLLCFGEAYFPM